MVTQCATARQRKSGEQWELNDPSKIYVHLSQAEILVASGQDDAGVARSGNIIA
jgi:hypothetical protein